MRFCISDARSVRRVPVARLIAVSADARLAISAEIAPEAAAVLFPRVARMPAVVSVETSKAVILA